jgi:hypothetical protein
MHHYILLVINHPRIKFLRDRIIGAPKKFIKWPCPLFRAKLTPHVIKGQIHLVRQSL